MSWIEKRRGVETKEEPAPRSPNLNPLEYSEQLKAAQIEAVNSAMSEMLPRKQEYIDAAVKEHADDSALYAFECRRYGDFLTLYASRLSKDGAPAKFSTGLNLLLVTEINLITGTAPGHEVEMEWHFYYHKGDGSRHASSPLRMPRDGEKLVAYSWNNPSHAIRGRPLYAQPNKLDDRGFMNYPETFRSGLMPTPAKDDEVRFLGIGSALLVPFGKGQQVLDAILSEMSANPTAARL